MAVGVLPQQPLGVHAVRCALRPTLLPYSSRSPGRRRTPCQARVEAASPSSSDDGPSSSGRGHTAGAASSTNLLGNNPQATSAEEQLRLLSAARRASQRAVHQATTVDARMYEQLLNAQTRLNKRLSETNAYMYHLEDTVARCHEDLMAAHQLLKQISMEFGTTRRLAQGVSAAVRFGVDPSDAVDKVDKLTQRLATLEAAVLQQRGELQQRVPQRVPVEWVGVASEVRIMGDFDGWTRGHELSAEDVTSDSVYARFEATLLLRPGMYRVKLLVDGQWRLANGWPTEDDADGNTVNVLVVQ